MLIASKKLKYDTIDIARSASYLDLHLDIDSKGGLRTNLYHKGYYYNFPIPAASAYGVYIYFSWYDIPELVILIMVFLIGGCC